jgi:hypothetical protein
MVWLYLSPSHLFVSQQYLSLCLLVEGEEEDGCLYVIKSMVWSSEFLYYRVALPLRVER